MAITALDYFGDLECSPKPLIYHGEGQMEELPPKFPEPRTVVEDVTG
jgi:hypothetical protein